MLLGGRSLRTVHNPKSSSLLALACDRHQADTKITKQQREEHVLMFPACACAGKYEIKRNLGNNCADEQCQTIAETIPRVQITLANHETEQRESNPPNRTKHVINGYLLTADGKQLVREDRNRIQKAGNMVYQHCQNGNYL